MGLLFRDLCLKLLEFHWYHAFKAHDPLSDGPLNLLLIVVDTVSQGLKACCVFKCGLLRVAGVL